MLTTYDNPINPFTDFIGWWKMDHLLGHNCCEVLSNEANLSELASDAEIEKQGSDAIDRIVKREPTIYKRLDIIIPDDDNGVPKAV